MVQNATLEIGDGGVLTTLRTLGSDLLEKNLVDALLVPVELPVGNNVVQTLVSDPRMLKAANPLAPVMPVNTAKIVSSITRVAPGQRKIGVVARSCELRAIIELVKLKQASLENIVLIGIDCFGTYSVPDYIQYAKESSSPTEDFLKKVKNGDDPNLRDACKVCEFPFPLKADIAIGLVGMDLDKSILLEAQSPVGEEILGALELPESDSETVEKRKTALNELISVRTKARDELFEQTRKNVCGLENLIATFAPCIGCHNCRVACPICYCKECLFDSPTMVDWEAEKYLSQAEKKGGLRMPADILFFHLTRLNHMATSCVGCGLCQESCPMNIPIFSIFRLVGSEVQKGFDYVPGKSLEDELPITTYKEEEFDEWGKEGFISPGITTKGMSGVTQI